MRDRLSLLAYLSGWRLVRAMPEPLAYALFAAIADVAWWRRGRGVRQLEANLARAVPGTGRDHVRELGRDAMRSYLRYWCDAFRLPGWTRERVVGTVVMEGAGAEPVREALGNGRGVVCALAHQGNWDHAGAWSTLALAPVTTVAERLKPEELFARFVAFREQLGMRILPLDGGRDLVVGLTRTLRQGGFVPLLADRDLTARGVPVRLLGEPARMAAGPAVFALSTGALLSPVSIWYRRLPPGSPSRWGIVIHFHAEVPVPVDGDRQAKVAQMTQGCADALSAGIRAHPQDWHMLQRVFDADVRIVAPLAPEPASENGRHPRSTIPVGTVWHRARQAVRPGTR